MNNDLLNNIDKMHTTEMGVQRIKRNLCLNTVDAVDWCKKQILSAKTIYRTGKNWYAETEHCIITVNAHSYTIITAHRKSQK